MSEKLDPTNPFQSPGEPSHADKGLPAASRRRGLYPPLGVRLAAAALAMLALLVRWIARPDTAGSNILAFVCGLVAVLVLGVWFVFFSGYSRRVRILSLFGGGSAVALAFALLRIDHVSGDLGPAFRPRWSRKPDQLLRRPVAESPSTAGGAAGSAVDTAESSENDFPQFLGPRRNARVEHVELGRDWISNPPTPPIWRQPIGAGWSAFSAVNDYAVTMEQRGDEEFVTCYEISTGKLIWAFATPTRHETLLGGVGPRSTPTIHEGRVYALGAGGELACLELATGRVVWRDNLLDRYEVPRGEDEKAVAWGRAGSPLIVDDLVVVPAGGPTRGRRVSLAAFRKVTGELAWEAGQYQISYSSPALATLAGVRQIISVNEAHVTGHDPQTGATLWQTEWPGSSTQDANSSQPVPLGADRLLLSKGYGHGAAVVRIEKAPTGEFRVEPVWRNHAVLKTKFTNVMVYQDHAYGLSDGTLECVELATGKRVWKRGRYGQGQILGVGGVILVLAESGELAMVEASPEAYRELNRIQVLDGKTWNNLCLTGKRLLVRNAEEAACYELP